MKKLILGIYLVFLITTNIQAFPSGTYQCMVLGTKIIYILKQNGRVKIIVNNQTTRRGNWLDDDDAAIIINNDMVIEDKGNNNYILGNVYPCTKINQVNIKKQTKIQKTKTQNNDFARKKMIQLKKILDSWNNAIKNRDLKTLSKLYANEVFYYQSNFSNKRCIDDKKRLFNKFPDFSQKINNISFFHITLNLYKVYFDKYVKTKKNIQEKIYPSYLIIDTSSANIKAKSDFITDSITLNKKTKTYNFSDLYTISGKLIIVKYFGAPNFGGEPNNDDIQDAYILELDTPIKIITSQENGINYTTKIYQIQLLINDFNTIKDKNDLNIKISGKFSSAIIGHRIRRLLFDVKNIE